MSKKSKSTTGPSRFAQPYIQGGANALTSEFNNTIGGLRETSGEFSNLIGDFARDRLQNGDAGVNAARGYNTDVLGGRYLNSNPYLDDMVNDTNEDIVNQSQAALGLRGLTGGSSYADIISRNVARNTTQIRGQEYGRERAAMDNAAGRAGSLAAAEYLPIQGLLSSLQAQQAPLNAASQYAGGIGGLLGGYQTQTQPTGILNNLLGAGAQLGGAAILACDERLKENIEWIGKTEGGVPLYRFDYIGGARGVVGPMAQEVAILQPDALGPEIDGYMTVNMGALV
jgi:hypothetical protein